MYIREYILKKLHERASKLGKVHKYYRDMAMIVLCCDSCGAEFERSRGSMDPKRISNNYYHVCDNCDSKRFAQEKGARRKKIWNLNASSDVPIDKL